MNETTLAVTELVVVARRVTGASEGCAGFVFEAREVGPSGMVVLPDYTHSRVSGEAAKQVIFCTHSSNGTMV